MPDKRRTVQCALVSDEQTPAQESGKSHQSYVLSEIWGSLPMGGSVENAPIHTLTRESMPRVPHEGTVPATRTDIRLDGQLAFVIDNVLTPQECDDIVAAGESMGFIAAAPGIRTPPGMRMNKACHWIADESLQGGIMARIRHLLPEELDGDYKLHDKLSHRVALYKYDAGDVFNTHIDGEFPGYSLSEDRSSIEEWEESLRSKLSLLIYLNGSEEGVRGGATELYGIGGSDHVVTPKKGSALFFRHGPDRNTSVLHKGMPVSGNVPKYVARINVMYRKA